MSKYEERCTKCFTCPACHETGNIYPAGICPYYQEKEAGEKKVQEELKKAQKEIDNLNTIIKNLRYKYRNVDETDIWKCNKKAL